MGTSGGSSSHIKLPANSLEYPICPTTRDGCDWSCYDCTASDDLLHCPNAGDFGVTFDDGPSINSVLVLDQLDAFQVKVGLMLLD